MRLETKILGALLGAMLVLAACGGGGGGDSAGDGTPGGSSGAASSGSSGAASSGSSGAASSGSSGGASSGSSGAASSGSSGGASSGSSGGTPSGSSGAASSGSSGGVVGASGTVDLRGGVGVGGTVGGVSVGSGGRGGNFAAQSAGGPVVLSKSGGLPALPSWQETDPSLGANPLILSSDATFIVTTTTLLGADGKTAATGLWVKSGVTMKLSHSAWSVAELDFADGVRVDGTLELLPLGDLLSSSGLYLNAGAISVHGAIRGAGKDNAAAGQKGGHGGKISLIAQRDVAIAGSVVTSGGAGDVGGDAGALLVYEVGPSWTATVTPGTLAVTGSLDTSGGKGRTGAGGAAADLAVTGYAAGAGACNAFVSGTLVATGGDGATTGGAGGNTSVTACGVGWVENVGTVVTSGGAGASGDGGRAGSIGFASGDAPAYVGGTLRGHGGAGTGVGGAGAVVSVGSAVHSVSSAPSSGVALAARVDVPGGQGANGGAGGSLLLSDAGSSNGLGVTVAGYDLVAATGGAGTLQGGKGGQISGLGVERYDAALGGNVVGTFTCDTVLDASGGDGTAYQSRGGDGGTLNVGTKVTDTTHAVLHPEQVQSSVGGSLVARGGKGVYVGGAGGHVNGYDASALVVQASVDLSGGDGGGGGGQGGIAYLASKAGTVSVVGALRGVGGASAYGTGGNGAGVTCSAGTVATLGAVTLDGGAGPQYYGGGGGRVSLVSATPPSRVTGVLSLRGGASGTGYTPGPNGSLELEYRGVLLTNGVYTP